MNQSYGDRFKKVCEGLGKLFGGGFPPFVLAVLIAYSVVGMISHNVGFEDGKEVGRQELLQEFNKTGWYYDERAKEFWRKESTCQ